MKSGRMFVLLFVIPLLFSGGCSTSKNSGHKPRLLLISFDGFRYDYPEKTETPNFDSFIKEGVTSEGLIPVFPTKTFPNHYSIVTGLYPEHTGIIANTMYDPEWDKWYRINDRNAVENGAWYQGEPIWNTIEKQELTAATMFWVGSEAGIQGEHPTYWKPYDGNMPERARIDTVVSWLSKEQNPADFATLYFELVDHAGHEHGLGSGSLIEAIQKSDRLVGYLKEELIEKNLWDSLNIIILSDHGMVELSAHQIILLDSIINMDHVERIIWDPATMIQPKTGMVDEVYQNLKEVENHYIVYKKEDLPDRYHLKNHRRVPDIVMMADPGYTILSESRKPGFLEQLPGATHGYDNKHKQMLAFFAARGPAFVSGDTVSKFQNIHLYELMNHLLHSRPAPNDGSLDSIRVLLKQVADPG